MITCLRIRLATLVVAALLAGCGGRGQKALPASGAKWSQLGLGANRQAFEKRMSGIDHVVIDPPPAVGKDYHPDFPPDLPFDPSKWKTASPPPDIASPSAPKGGKLRVPTTSWPPTLRTEGPDSHNGFTSVIQGLIYEPLLGYSMKLKGFVPQLARYWQVSPDHLTYRFRIDPRARWADGRPVTADDVKATFEHFMNPDIKDPAVTHMWRSRIKSVRILDRLTVEVTARKPEWRNMLLVANSWIYPAAYIRMDSETYLTKWNWKLPPGSGPYELLPSDIRMGRSILIRRRKNWWGRDLPRNRGQYNFDEIEWDVVRTEELTWQKFLANEFDIYYVGRAQQWVEELPRQREVLKGWIQMRKIHTLSPQGYIGYAFNMRKPPFDNRDVRLAFAHLLNREEMFSKFFFYQYKYLDSYFPGEPWSRPNARRVRYDPQAARALLAKAGWTHRDAENYLVNDKGERFPVLTLEYSDPGWERIHDVFRNALWSEAGIKLDLRLIDDATLLKTVWGFRFSIVFWGWTGSLFPAPQFDFASRYADVPDSDNLNGFKNPEFDRLLAKYRLEFSLKKRIKLLQRMDQILFHAHPYALAWYGDFQRVCYWDRLGHPPEYLSRYGDASGIFQYWWYDPTRAQNLRKNEDDGRGECPGHPLNQRDPPDQTWWLHHSDPMGAAR